jgi:hypothetical protein
VSETKQFPILDVITVASGILVSDHGIGAVYELCGFMLDDTLMTHQLPAASRACEAALTEQHPWLAITLRPPQGDMPALKAWCAQIVAEHGDTLPIASIGNPDWKRGNALNDLVDIAGDRPIIAVETPDAS